jgi:hypothetical protein
LASTSLADDRLAASVSRPKEGKTKRTTNPINLLKNLFVFIGISFFVESEEPEV